MFADPQSVTYNTVAQSLPAVGRNDTQSEYKLTTSAGIVYDLILSHQFGKRNRAVARLRRDSVVADSLIPAQNVPASMTCTFTMDFPTAGLLPADVQLLGQALVDWLSDANMLKLAGGET